MPQAYVPYTITGVGARGMLIRTLGAPLGMLDTIRREVASVDPDIALTNSGSIQDILKDYSYATPKFGLISISSFAAIGLLLVLVGVFSVMSYTVTLQTQEIGIRMALGAQQRDILRMVLKKSLALIVAGILCGLFASFALTRFLASQIWGVSPTDPLTFTAVLIVIIIVGFAASFFPARRATRVDPMIALRNE
jgi:putative ABC transport system permease protein